MREPSSSRKRAAKQSPRAKPRRASNETRRSILQALGTDEQKIGAALKKMDARTGAEVISRLGHQLGNLAVHRVLTHAAPVTISLAPGTSISEKSRKVLEMILRAAGVRSADVVRTGRRKGLELIDIEVRTGNPAALVEASEAEVGKSVECFRKPGAASAYHFEIVQ